MIQVVKRSFGILELLAQANTLSLREIAERIDLKKTTVCNILATLVELGMVEKNEHGSYQMGTGIHALAGQRDWRARLQEIGPGVIDKLSRATGETCLLTVVQHRQVAVIAESLSNQALVVQPGSWRTGQWYGWATGQLLLAHQRRSTQEAIIREQGLPGLIWPDAGQSSMKLKAHLAAIRHQSHVVKTDSDSAITSLAVPVFSADGSCIAAIGLCLPESRYSILPAGTLLQAMQGYAKRLCDAMGE